MAHLSSAQLQRALTCAGELAELEELEQVPEQVPRLLRRLIACDHAGFNVIDLATGRPSSVVADPADAVFSGGPELLARFAEQNPLVVQAKQGNMNALRLSDHISRRDMHQTDLYNHIYKLVGVEHQVILQFPPLFNGIDSSRQVVGISLARQRRDFSDSEILLLQSLSPIFARTLERLHELALMRTLASDPGDDRVVVLFDADGFVAWASPEAEQRLGVVPGRAIPEDLRIWARKRAGGLDLLTVDSSAMIVGDQLARFSFVQNAYPGLDALYAARSRADETVLVAQLGITTRQAEVLALLTDGRSTSDIADTLVVSQRTVEKHLEDLYRRLGVRNRSQAILRALHVHEP